MSDLKDKDAGEIAAALTREQCAHVLEMQRGEFTGAVIEFGDANRLACLDIIPHAFSDDLTPLGLAVAEILKEKK